MKRLAFAAGAIAVLFAVDLLLPRFLNAYYLTILSRIGVAVLAGTSFGSFGEGYLRFSYANSIENIRQAAQRIGECLSAKKQAATA